MADKLRFVSCSGGGVVRLTVVVTDASVALGIVFLRQYYASRPMAHHSEIFHSCLRAEGVLALDRGSSRAFLAGRLAFGLASVSGAGLRLHVK